MLIFRSSKRALEDDFFLLEEPPYFLTAFPKAFEKHTHGTPRNRFEVRFLDVFQFRQPKPSTSTRVLGSSQVIY